MLESLEPRRLFSGNVTLKIVGDQLRMIGDDQANEFEINAPVGG